MAFDQSVLRNNTHGEGFQLYPHIHGTTSEAENVSNLYGSLQKPTDSVYPHLYNLQTQSNSSEIDNPAQVQNKIFLLFLRYNNLKLEVYD